MDTLLLFFGAFQRARDKHYLSFHIFTCIVSNKKMNLFEAAAKRLGLVGDQDIADTGLSSW